MLSLGLSVVLTGQAWPHSPVYHWRTIQTEHFWIHYYQGEGESARHVADIAEEVYSEVTRFLNSDPGKVHVVLNGHTDFANGYATLFPKHIELYTTAPQGKWAGTREQDWLRLVFTHEYTHMVQFSIAEGFTRLGKMLFGDLALLPNGLIPGWATEGIAVNAETIYTNGGRGRNPYFEMQFRTPLWENRMWNLAQAGCPGDTKPPLDRFYISGYYLLNYIRRHYGSQTLAEIYHEYSFFPFLGIGFSSWMATGHTSGTIYRDMLAEFRNKFYGQRKNIERQGLTPIHQLARQKAASFYHPQWSSDGKNLYAYLVSYDSLPALVKVEVATGEVKRLLTVELTNCSSFNLGKKETIFLAKLSTGLFSEDDIFSDLYSYNPKTGKQKRLTRGFRAWSPALSPDGRQLLCVKNEGVYNNLYLLNLDGTSPRKLTHLSRASFHSPAWSPDGKRIAVAVNISGKQDIYLLNPDGSALHPLYARDSFGEFDPSWSPDGRYLLFCSDRTGINNIYAFDLKTEKLYQVTNVLTGAFQPAVSPGMDKLAFTQYSSEGFSLCITDFAPERWREVKYQRNPVTEATGESEPKVQYTSRPYRPWRQLLQPTFWLPVIGKDEQGLQIGGVTFSEDVLSQHSLTGELLAGIHSHRPSYLFSYSNHQSYPIIRAEIYDQLLCEEGLFHGTLPDSLNEYWSQEQGGNLYVGLPLSLRSNTWTTSLFLQLGLTDKRVSRLSEIPPGYERQAPFTGNYGGISARLLFLNGYTTLKDILPIYSPLIELNWETTERFLGSDYRASAFGVNILQHLPVGNYLRIFPHHILAFRFSLQAQQGNYRYEKHRLLPRGYDETEPPFDHKSLALASVQYEFPLWYVDNGWGTFPLFLRRITGDFFLDSGSGWRGPLNCQSWSDIVQRAKTSWGAELKLHTFLFYRIPLWFGIGVAFRPGKRIGYLTLGLSGLSADRGIRKDFYRGIIKELLSQRLY